MSARPVARSLAGPLARPLAPSYRFARSFGGGLLLTGLVLLTTACAGSPLPGARTSAATDAEIAQLKARVVELQRRAAVTEVELERLRQQVAALGGGRVGASNAPPPARREPIRTETRRDEADQRIESRGPAQRPRPSFEEEDLDPVEPLGSAPDPAPIPERNAPSEPAVTPPVAIGPGSSVPVSPAAQAIYDRGYTQYHQGRHLDAESSFQRFLGEHSNTELADNAQYWIGEARLARGDVRGALAAFRETVSRWPDGNKVPDALLKMGDCLERLGDTPGARAAYEEVGRRFPGTAAAAVADERRESLR